MAAIAMWMTLVLLRFSAGSISAVVYGGYDYWVNTDMGYEGARSTCEKYYGGRLVDFYIEGDTYNRGLEHFIEHYVVGNTGTSTTFWIGLNERNGRWQWSDGNSAHMSANWHAYEPDDGTAQENQDCGVRKYSGGWG
ncbi:MRC2 [Branchiostoma lanceolatum]|uniref:MRC2 protein n=1 Tax=Branchiostoma lanceolatum TaxID=7740 RepID=A0A8J9VJZ9_BRALA|nr:MRC2 [Branchiostoma lanceolatum]